MIKGLYILMALTAAWIGVAFGDTCLFQMELWSNEDPTKFNYCNPYTNQSAVGDCLPETGFVKNETVTGCVPWLDWNDEYVTKVNVSDLTCDEGSYLQPHGVVNPRVFYLCIAENTAPVPLECPEDRAFFAKNNYLGCFSWAMWRNLTGYTSDIE